MSAENEEAGKKRWVPSLCLEEGKGAGEEESPHHIRTDAYFPAGSISSHRDSLSHSDDDASQPAPLADFCRLLSDDRIAFQPTTENVILFEVCSPAMKSTDSLRLDSLDRWRQACIPLFEDTEMSPMFSTDEDKPQQVKLFDVNEGRMRRRGTAESWRLSSVASETDVSASLPCAQYVATILHLQRVVAQLKWEIEMMKKTPEKVETCEKSTMTLSSDIIPTLRREVEHLASACKRYERQNQELRTEIQACTSDLMQLDKTKTKLTRELKKAITKAEAFEGEFLKISEFVDKVLNRQGDEELSAALTEKDAKHLTNYVSSQVEIIGSRYSRLLAAYDRISEENQRLKQDLDKRSSSPAPPKPAPHHKDKLKDQFILKLEQTLSAYKEKMLEAKDDSDGEKEAMMNKTENLTSRLKAICEDVQPFRSQHGSPERTYVEQTPESGFSFVEHNPIPAALDTQARMSFPNSSDSQNDTSEGTMLKPETPVQVKRTAWKQKQIQRNVELAVDKYRPVLLARDSKVPASRCSKVEEDPRRPTQARQSLSKRPENAKKPDPKSVSLERKRSRGALPRREVS